MTNNNGYFGDRPCSQSFKPLCVFDCEKPEVSQDSCPGQTEAHSGFFQLHGSLFKWLSAHTSFNDHKSTCDALGGKLAEFRTVQEYLGILQFSGS